MNQEAQNKRRSRSPKSLQEHVTKDLRISHKDPDPIAVRYVCVPVQISSLVGLNVKLDNKLI